MAPQGHIIASGAGEWRYLDVVAERGGKLEAIEWVRALYGIPAGRCMTAGDSFNDVEMFKARRSLGRGGGQGGLCDPGPIMSIVSRLDCPLQGVERMLLELSLVSCLVVHPWVCHWSRQPSSHPPDPVTPSPKYTHVSRLPASTMRRAPARPLLWATRRPSC
jgi:hypothetical protein